MLVNFGSSEGCFLGTHKSFLFLWTKLLAPSWYPLLTFRETNEVGAVRSTFVSRPCRRYLFLFKDTDEFMHVITNLPTWGPGRSSVCSFYAGPWLLGPQYGTFFMLLRELAPKSLWRFWDFCKIFLLLISTLSFNSKDELLLLLLLLLPSALLSSSSLWFRQL
jgi:hypothetical protein